MPPLPIVVVPLRTGRAATPDEGVTVEGVLSPGKYDSDLVNADPGVVTTVSV